jgi:HTH-type transcriptional regulator/antitoxin HigA
MITNERQYKITKSQAEKFREALREFSEIELAHRGIDPIIIVAQRSSLEHQLADLEQELAEYEKLRSGKTRQLPLTSVAELGTKLIQARIVQGFSQRDLADRMGMKEQQIQRYEQDRYLSASLARCAEVADMLGLDVHGDLNVRQSDLFDRLLPQKENDTIAFNPAKLPVKEMKKRGWLNELAHLQTERRYSDRQLAAMFLRDATRGRQTLALHKQHIRAGSKQDKYALLAWKARVLWKARRLDIAFDRWRALDIATVRQLAELSARGDGPQQAVSLLRERGVAVVFEEHLPQTHLDGAAMLLDEKAPVIGLTLRFNRLDSFWFVLLHECAHILLHANRGLRDGFFDDEQAPARDAVEIEADEYARNALIPSELWTRSLIRFATSSEQVVQFAQNAKIGVAVVAGRIRRERNDYRLFPELVGQGEIKKLISAAGYWEL